MVNAATTVARLAPAPTLPFSAVFARVFHQLSALHRSFRDDGVLIVAVWDGGHVDDYVHVAVGEGTSAAVLGRHDRCDVRLARDPAVSLRHALVALRRVGLAELRVRVWDLGSGMGLVTEHGAAYEALVAEGPLFLRVGGYHLFLLPTGALSPVPWGRTALDTWASFPERVLLDERRPARPRRPADRDSETEPSSPFGRGLTVTQVVPAAGSLWSHAREPSDGSPVGARIELADDAEAIEVPVTERRLDRGVLIGRYARCQLVAAPDGLSRVHLLIARDAGQVWAFDTASTNGTTAAGLPVRQQRLSDGAELVLARTVTLRWRE